MNVVLSDRTRPWAFADLVDLPEDGRVPDVSVVRIPGAPPAGAGRYPYGAGHASLVVEVVSPSSRKTDRFAKPGECAATGIALLWRVETDPDTVVLAFRLDAAVHVPAGEAHGPARLPVRWGTTEIDVARLSG